MIAGRDSKGHFIKGNVPWNKRVKCPPHWWIIDSNNVGYCKFCDAIKDFDKLQRRYKKEASRKQAKIAVDSHNIGRPKVRRRYVQHI